MSRYQRSGKIFGVSVMPVGDLLRLRCGEPLGLPAFDPQLLNKIVMRCAVKVLLLSS